MQEVVVRVYDDLEFAVKGKRVVADKVIRVGLNGTWYDIELCAENAQHLTDYLAPYLSVGRNLGGRPTNSPTAKKRGPYRPRDYYTGLRKWADANGRTYQFNTGVSYSAKLKRDYDAFLTAEDQPQEAS